MFLIIAIGLAAGAGQLLVSILITFFSVVIIYTRNFFKKNDNKILSLGDVDILSIDVPKEKFNLFEIYASSRKPNLSYELISAKSSDDIFRATYRLDSEITIEEKKELINWMSEIQEKNISISLSKTIKIDQ